MWKEVCVPLLSRGLHLPPCLLLLFFFLTSHGYVFVVFLMLFLITAHCKEAFKKKNPSLLLLLVGLE